jgi:hypothetical protein
VTETIGLGDIKLEYASLEEARRLPGLRLILGAHTIPGPWREACKGIFHVKKIPYVSVTSTGKDGGDRELLEWTAQTSAPVAIWNDEPPRSTWIQQLQLAERLAPDPPLIPGSIADRTLMFGLSNEICGENGFGWSRRLLMIHRTVTNPKTGEGARSFWLGFGAKYGYSAGAAEAAPARIVEILRCLGERLERQRASGSRFFVGERLSALDVYWAAFAVLLRPLPPELCPMFTLFRDFYLERDPGITAAVSPLLFEHRDFVYREYLELPVAF